MATGNMVRHWWCPAPKLHQGSSNVVDVDLGVQGTGTAGTTPLLHTPGEAEQH